MGHHAPSGTPIKRQSSSHKKCGLRPVWKFLLRGDGWCTILFHRPSVYIYASSRWVQKFPILFSIFMVLLTNLHISLPQNVKYNKSLLCRKINVSCRYRTHWDDGRKVFTVKIRKPFVIMKSFRRVSSNKSFNYVNLTPVRALRYEQYKYSFNVNLWERKLKEVFFLIKQSVLNIYSDVLWLPPLPAFACCLLPTLCLQAIYILV